MKLTRTFKSYALGGLAAAAVAGVSTIATAQMEGDVLIGEGMFPESIAATPDGGFITGSVSTGNILRWSPGDDSASVWATAEGITLGVFAAGDTVYACVNAPTFGDGSLLSFDIDSAEQTGAYPVPGGGLCNDVVVGPDGSVFVTDTGALAGRPGAVFALAPINEDGDLGLQTVVASTSIGGANGLAFIGDTLYLGDVTTGALFAIELDGTTLVSLATLSLSRELAGPDGLWAASDGSGFWVAENGAGRISFVTVDGTSANVETVAEAEWASATSVAEVGGTLYVVDTNFPALGNPDATPGPFYAHAISLDM